MHAPQDFHMLILPKLKSKMPAKYHGITAWAVVMRGAAIPVRFNAKPVTSAHAPTVLRTNEMIHQPKLQLHFFFAAIYITNII